MKNKTIINKIKKLSDNQIKQGIELRNLALSFESRLNEYTLKELKKEIQPFLKKFGNERGLKNGR